MGPGPMNFEGLFDAITMRTASFLVVNSQCSQRPSGFHCLSGNVFEFDENWPCGSCYPSERMSRISAVGEWENGKIKKTKTIQTQPDDHMLSEPCLKIQDHLPSLRRSQNDSAECVLFRVNAIDPKYDSEAVWILIESRINMRKPKVIEITILEIIDDLIPTDETSL